jgi:hypothetical protein
MIYSLPKKGMRISYRGFGKGDKEKQTLSCRKANIRSRAASDAIGWAS